MGAEPQRVAGRRRTSDPDDQVFLHRESVGRASQAGVVSPLGVSLMATGITRGAPTLLRGCRRLRHRA